MGAAGFGARIGGRGARYRASVDHDQVAFLWRGDDGATGANELPRQAFEFALVQLAAHAIEMDVHDLPVFLSQPSRFGYRKVIEIDFDVGLIERAND